MAGFDAGKAVDPLDWSLRPYVDATGTVPEPTDTEFRAYMRTMKQLTGVDEAATDDELNRRLSGLDDDALQQMTDDLIAALVKLTKGSPSVEQIKAMPQRPQRAFVRWLMQEMNDPNSSSAATRR